MTLSIAEGLNKDEFEKARDKAFLTAVDVWNALDTSNRPRIRLPAKVDEDTINIPEQSGLVKQSDEDE